MPAVKSIERSCQDSTPYPGVARMFADSIEHLYRVAITVDPSPRSQIAYACYLAEHGQPLEAFGEFDEILGHEKVCEDPAILNEIVHRLARIEKKLEAGSSSYLLQQQQIDFWENHDGHEPDEACFEDPVGGTEDALAEVADAIRQLMDGTRQRSPREFSRIVAEMDLNTLEEIGDLLGKVQEDRALCQRRRTGMSLLKLALFCGRKEWHHVQVECIREALRCFAQVAMQVRNGQVQARSELAALSTREI